VSKKCNHSETGLRVELTIGVVLRVRGRICLWSKEVIHFISNSLYRYVDLVFVLVT
jgi:hypothetical protein